MIHADWRINWKTKARGHLLIVVKQQVKIQNLFDYTNAVITNL